MKETSDVPEIPLKSPETTPPEAEYRFAGYELDCRRWQLRWDGEPLTLHRKCFDLLLCLVRARGHVVSKDELMEAVWPGQFVEENNLAQQISTLRKTLTRHPDGSRLIETIPGRGYRFLPEVATASPATVSSGRHLLLNTEESITRITVEETEDDAPTPVGDLPLAAGASLSAGPSLSEGRPAAPGGKGHALAANGSPVLAAGTDLRLPRPETGRRRRPLLLFLLTGLAIAAVAAGTWFGVQWWRNRSSGPPVQVVLMPLEGTTGDTTLDHALNDALRFDLAESPFVTLLSRAQVSDTMRQMKRPAGEALSPVTAREVCERTSSQAVVHAVLARTGQQFLLTGEAVSCVSGNTLASTEQGASRTEDLPLSLGELTGRLRQRLGEARRSVARFATPAYTFETVSLEALKANYQSTVLGNSGRIAEALEAGKKAVGLDPDFAMAWFNLSVAQTNMDDQESARESLRKAYDLRNTVDPQSQRVITARYEAAATGDLFAALRNAKLWTAEYPRSAYAWDALSGTQAQLGDYTGAIFSEQRAANLRPDIGMAWVALGQAQLHAGDLPAARASAERGLLVSPDLDGARLVLMRVALHQQDRALAAEQVLWASAHLQNPSPQILQAELARVGGRFSEAQQLTDRASLAYQEVGSAAGAARARKLNAMELIASGDRGAGERLFRAERVDPEEPADLMSLALLGDVAESNRLLQGELQKHEQDTQWHFVYAPMIRAIGALSAGQPQRALEALNGTGVLDGVDAQICYLRGTASLALHDPGAAAVQFHKAVEHPGFDSSYAYSLSWLGLARAEALLGKRDDAAAAYRKYLALTANADADAAIVMAARQEYSALSTPK